MTIFELGALGEFVGAIAVVFTLGYLAAQIRQNTRQARLNSIQAINASNDSAFDPIYIPENSLIWTKGHQSLSDLTDHEQVVFDMLMTRLFGSFDTTTYQYQQGSFDDEMYWGLARFLASFTSTDGGADWLKKRSNIFSSGCLANIEKVAT